MDVVEHDIVGRRGDVGGGPDVERNHHKCWCRQDEKADRWRWWREEEWRRRWRQEEDRRWRGWRKAEKWIAEEDDSPLDEHDLVARRRRQAIIEGRIRGRRQRWCSQIAQAAARVVAVRAVRITVKVGPVGFRRVGFTAPPPRDSFATCRDDAAYPSRQRMLRINIQELEVASERVALQRSMIGILGAKVSNGAVTPRRGYLMRGLQGGRVGGPLEELKRRLDFARMPRND